MNDNTRIGILGGGQLAKMLAESEVDSKLTFVSADVEGSCAFDSNISFTKDLSNEQNLKEFAQLNDVITFDSEHLGVEFADGLKNFGVEVYPSADFVRLSGDRLFEKNELNRLGIKTANYEEVNQQLSKEEYSNFIITTFNTKSLSENGIVLKTRHGGYDGKGQWVLFSDATEIDIDDAIDESFELTKNPGIVVEGIVDFDFECSIIASRSTNGEIATWPLIHNIHKNSILDLSRCPAPANLICEATTESAIAIAKKICIEHNYVGTICVELFFTKEGLIVNEIAPRVHNSGHLTIEGSKTSQFKNHINAIRGETLGQTDVDNYCAMINIVGQNLSKETEQIIDSNNNVYLHWYNKEVRPDRKVGHITIVSKTEDELNDLISRIQSSMKKL